MVSKGRCRRLGGGSCTWGLKAKGCHLPRLLVIPPQTRLPRGRAAFPDWRCANHWQWPPRPSYGLSCAFLHRWALSPNLVLAEPRTKRCLARSPVAVEAALRRSGSCQLWPGRSTHRRCLGRRPDEGDHVSALEQRRFRDRLELSVRSRCRRRERVHRLWTLSFFLSLLFSYLGGGVFEIGHCYH